MQIQSLPVQCVLPLPVTQTWIVQVNRCKKKSGISIKWHAQLAGWEQRFPHLIHLIEGISSLILPLPIKPVKKTKKTCMPGFLHREQLRVERMKSGGFCWQRECKVLVRQHNWCLLTLQPSHNVEPKCLTLQKKKKGFNLFKSLNCVLGCRIQHVQAVLYILKFTRSMFLSLIKSNQILFLQYFSDTKMWPKVLSRIKT